MSATNRNAAVPPSLVDRWKDSCRDRTWDMATVKARMDLIDSLFETVCRAFYAAFPDESNVSVHISNSNGWILVECEDNVGYGLRIYELGPDGFFFLSDKVAGRPRLTVIQGGRQ